MIKFIARALNWDFIIFAVVLSSIAYPNGKVAFIFLQKYFFTIFLSIGLSNFCLACGHGGHSEHMMSWFETETQCPSGCGCYCVVETASMLES